MDSLPPWAQAIARWLAANRMLVLALVVALGGAGTAVLVVDADGPDGPTPPVTFTVKVDGPDPGIQPDVPLAVTPAGREQVRAARAGELGDPLRETADPSRTPAGELEGPLAAQELPGCRTRFASNFSSRNGARVRVIVWHQTVSRERGWASQDALTAMADRTSSGVSWNVLIGRSNGNCTYTVPLTMKAWTQGNANPFAVGIEVEAFGDEPSYVTGAGERRLLAVTREIGRRMNVPMQRGKVVNCQPVVSGIVEHSDLGACGGGHADVTPWPTDDLIRKLQKPETSLLKVDQRIIRGVQRPRGTGHTRRYWCERAQEQRMTIRDAARDERRGWDRRDRAERFQAISKPYVRACR